MNRIEHFLRAKTQYNLHSPLVYRLYTEVLFSRCPGRGRSFEDVVWRLEEYYGLPHSHPSPFTSHHPHGSEADWQAIIASAEWQVTLDLYTCGIAIASSRLTKQHFLLR